MRQRKPGAGPALRDMAGGLELRGGSQKLFGIGLAALGQLQPKIQVRLKNIRLRRYRVAIGGNRLLHLAQGVFRKAEIEPRHVICGISVHHLAQQRFSRAILLLLNQLLRFGEFRQRRHFLGNGGVMGRLARICSFAMSAGRRIAVLGL